MQHEGYTKPEVMPQFTEARQDETGMRGMEPNMRVNVGCGASPTPGWVNFDNSFSVKAARWPLIVPALVRLRVIGLQSARLARVADSRNIQFANATARIPCTSSSVSAVYSSHMIEHLDRGEARAFLAEVRRILRPGGVVRIAAPDIARLVQKYLATGDADGFIAATHMGLNRPADIMAWMKWVLVGPRHHLWMYDGHSLAKLLREAGFADVAIMPPGKTNIADPGDLDLEERASESVYAEAIQPLSDCGRGWRAVDGDGEPGSRCAGQAGAGRPRSRVRAGGSERAGAAGSCGGRGGSADRGRR
jgi:predicted SAM-dependent methyltransferase